MDIQIGDKIKELRKARKITQEQLADAIGISFQAVSKWENHIALPDITLVPALANYFNVTCDELLGVRLMEKKKKLIRFVSSLLNIANVIRKKAV